MEAIRAFIAIELPEDVRQQLDAVEQQIQSKAGEVARALSEVNIGEIGRVHVTQLHLFRSDLRPSGAVYTSLYSFPLR